MQYVVRLKTNGRYAFLHPGRYQSTGLIDEAKRFGTVQEADKERSSCNSRWVQYARIISVRSRK